MHTTPSTHCGPKCFPLPITMELRCPLLRIQVLHSVSIGWQLTLYRGTLANKMKIFYPLRNKEFQSIKIVAEHTQPNISIETVTVGYNKP